MEITKREALYTEFISECTRLAIEAYSSTLDRAEHMLPALALLQCIRLVVSDEVYATAK